MIDATRRRRRTAEGTVKFSPIFPSPHGAARGPPGCGYDEEGGRATNGATKHDRHVSSFEMQKNRVWRWQSSKGIGEGVILSLEKCRCPDIVLIVAWLPLPVNLLVIVQE